MVKKPKLLRNRFFLKKVWFTDVYKVFSDQIFSYLVFSQKPHSDALNILKNLKNLWQTLHNYTPAHDSHCCSYDSHCSQWWCDIRRSEKTITSFGTNKVQLPFYFCLQCVLCGGKRDIIWLKVISPKCTTELIFPIFLENFLSDDLCWVLWPINP